jgi:hypothetical protein
MDSRLAIERFEDTLAKKSGGGGGEGGESKIS